VAGNFEDKPVHLIVNPNSGYGGNRIRLGHFRAVARRAGIPVVEHITTGPGDATGFAAEARDEAAAVIVWGGDGTVNETVNALAGSDTPMLVCPVGTENLLAKELRTPSDPREIVAILRNGLSMPSDVGVINGQNFMVIVGVGFDGEVIRRVASARTGHISHLSYFWPIWRTFWEHDFPRLRVTLDGEEAFDDYGLAFVGNISRYAVGLRICRDADYSDGLLDMVIFHCNRQASLVLHAGWTLLRMHPLKGGVTYRKFRTATIETDRSVACQVDGDVGPSSPFHISVAGGSVNLLVPPGRPSWGIWPWTGDVA
jgi:YegS/Rv2252/BmrU family lipid kinase